MENNNKNNILTNLVNDINNHNKLKKKFLFLEKLSQISLIGNLFKKKRDEIYSKYAVSLSLLQMDYLNYLE
tara:strand:+ start:742 stop:954 length:213 start_codon:yes stop_codon:yes gene_type:complete